MQWEKSKHCFDNKGFTAEIQPPPYTLLLPSPPAKIARRPGSNFAETGVTADNIREGKDQIVDLFQGSSPPVVVEETLEVQDTEGSTSLEGSASNDPSKDAKTGKKKRNLSFNINWTPLNALTRPLLIAAAKSGGVNAVRLRLDVVGDIGYKDKDHCTALVWAAPKGHTEVVKLLLAKGAKLRPLRALGQQRSTLRHTMDI